MSLIFAMKPLIFSMFNNCGHLELFSLSDSLFEHLFHVTDGETVGLELVDDVDCLPLLTVQLLEFVGDFDAKEKEDVHLRDAV